MDSVTLMKALAESVLLHRERESAEAIALAENVIRLNLAEVPF